MKFMIFNIITIFPGFFDGPFNHTLIKRASERDIIGINIIDLRDYTEDKHHTVDDAPYGGGSGMVMKPEPFYKAYDDLVESGRLRKHSPVVYLSPTGRRLTQTVVHQYAVVDEILFLCGRYEGVDQRVIDGLVTDEISIGDYVISGGELAAMVMIEAITRVLPGAISKEESFIEDSFFSGLLDYPHYTRPPEYRNMKVPDVLLSGDHKEIEKWRRNRALELTKERRPDLLDIDDD
ncbi:MAG: tRNA (guanosine(37)-N1)-methyltransferase TrmD [Acidobacteria bacterium]|nr:tRNA (guanosine(37)-N1)-methyltransferase TrmD [Acidobacteriota bacterium]